MNPKRPEHGKVRIKLITSTNDVGQAIIETFWTLILSVGSDAVAQVVGRFQLSLPNQLPFAPPLPQLELPTLHTSVPTFMVFRIRFL